MSQVSLARLGTKTCNHRSGTCFFLIVLRAPLCPSPSYLDLLITAFPARCYGWFCSSLRKPRAHITGRPGRAWPECGQQSDAGPTQPQLLDDLTADGSSGVPSGDDGRGPGMGEGAAVFPSCPHSDEWRAKGNHAWRAPSAVRASLVERAPLEAGDHARPARGLGAGPP